MPSYSNKMELLIQKDPDSFVDSFRTNVLSKLKTMECRTEIEGNSIQFKRIVRYFPHSGPGRNEILKLIREGSVKIEKMDSGKIKIDWEVKLEPLLFISVWTGLLAGFGFGFVNASILIFMIGGIFFSLISYGIGYYLIRTRIDDIIFTSV